jgi:hypothetical protein
VKAVKKNKLIKGALVALLLASPCVLAGTSYPEPFEPKVLIQNPDLIEKGSQAAAAPHKESSVAPPASKYPEPFEPKVLVQNPELIAKHGQTQTAARPATSSNSEVTSSQSSSASASAEDPLSQNAPIILVVVALGGIILWSMKRSGSKAQEIPSYAPSGFSGASAGASVVAEGTGVARYLKGLPESANTAVTGVAKYLRNMPVATAVAAVETGVAKYLKSLPVPPVVATDESGVTKYLKNIGK